MDYAFLQQRVMGNRILDFLIAAAIVLVGLLVIKIFSIWVKRLKRFSEKTETLLDDLLATLLGKIAVPGLYITSVYLALQTLKMPAGLNQIVNALQLAILAFFVARSLTLFLSYSVKMYFNKRREDLTQVKSLGAMLSVVKFLVWALAVIVFLDNIGFKVSTMLAGLGIGGVAIAIAAQALLKDFFSYFSIVFDRPFKLGDFIIVGDFMGTVEYIGIKTTRVRSLGGEQVVFSNTDLTDSRVRNYQLMEKRRVLFRLGVTYQTPLPLLKEIPRVIEEVIRRTPDTAFDRAHFFNYGNFSLDIEVVYFVLGPDYNHYMDIQQEINLGIKAEFEQRGIEFAYPSQTVYLQKT